MRGSHQEVEHPQPRFCARSLASPGIQDVLQGQPSEPNSAGLHDNDRTLFEILRDRRDVGGEEAKLFLWSSVAQSTEQNDGFRVPPRACSSPKSVSAEIRSRCQRR